MLHGKLDICVLPCWFVCAVILREGSIEVSHDARGSHNGKPPVSFHDLVQEGVRGVTECNMYIDDG